MSRNEWFFKWGLYTGVTLLCFLAQGLLQRAPFWGVIPFLYPVLPAIVASCEGPRDGMIYALFVGVCCDLLLPASIPCFYTLIFPVVGLVCAQLGGVLSASTGILASLAVSAAAFVLTDFFHCLVLWLQGQMPWQAGASVMLREFCVSALFVIPISLLFRLVYRRTRF